jgi:arylsulfatase A-like enzyme
MTSRTVQSPEPSTPGAQRSAAAWWFAAALVPPIGFRFATLAAVGAAPGWIDARGLASDFAAGIAIGLVAMSLSHLHRVLGAAWIALWFAIALGDAEHVLVNGAHVSAAYWAFLIDPIFVTGSALQPTLTIPIAILAPLTLAAVWCAARRSRALLSIPGVLLGLLAMSAGLALWPPPLSAPEWRLSGTVESNLRSITASDAEPALLTTPDPLPRHSRRESPDLDGVPRIEFPARRPNVLLILLEGISGAHIDAIADASGITADPALPRLDRLARNQIAYTNFIAQQRQTNRGEYALLCGDWPKLDSSVPRMSEYVARGGVLCLPAALRDLGYQTVYLQSAPIGFMLKDQFMTRIGFESVLGNAWFAEARSRTNWGVDDPTLFEGALSQIEQLSREDRPWFLTLLTVGTHHPYNVPSEFVSPGSSGFARAALQADAALGDFVEALAQRGVLRDTLVLITSDESTGLPEAAAVDPLTLLLSRNWGFLIVMAPGAAPAVIDEAFTQSDLALSILDAVGAGADVTGEFGGRSAFRRYEIPRRLAFGNTYQRRTFAVDPSGVIDVCHEDFSACSRFRGEPGRPFQAGAVAEGNLPETDRIALREWIEPYSASRAIDQGALTLALIGEQRVPIITGPARNQLVYGGQGLVVPARSSIELIVDVELRGGIGQVSIRMNLLAAKSESPIASDEVQLVSGDRVRLRSVVETGTRLDAVESRFIVFERTGEELELVFHRASLQVEEADRVAEGASPERTAHEVERIHAP